MHVSNTKVFVRYKTVLYLAKTFVVEMLYYCNLLCYVKCSTSLLPLFPKKLLLHNQLASWLLTIVNCPLNYYHIRIRTYIQLIYYKCYIDDTYVHTFSWHLNPQPWASTTLYLNLRAMRATAFVLFSHSRTRAPLHTRCRISTLGGGMWRGRGRRRGWGGGGVGGGGGGGGGGGDNVCEKGGMVGLRVVQ